jgi:uncharacterized protein
MPSWLAERLSIGLTRALAASIAARLPNAAVTTMTPVERPMRQVLTDVTTFDTNPGHDVILAARWTIADGSGHVSLLSEEAALVEPLASANDAAAVAAMSRAVEDLASRIATGIEHSLPNHRNVL